LLFEVSGECRWSAKGKIISASSIAGHEGYAMLGLYSATKCCPGVDSGGGKRTRQ